MTAPDRPDIRARIRMPPGGRSCRAPASGGRTGEGFGVLGSGLAFASAGTAGMKEKPRGQRGLPPSKAKTGVKGVVLILT